MEVFAYLIVLVFIIIYVLNKGNKSDREVEDSLTPTIPDGGAPFIDLDSLREDAKQLGISLRYYERNRDAIIMLRQAYPHEDVQRELDFINESNESIKRQTVSGVPPIVLVEEFRLLYMNMHLRLNLTRNEFLHLIGGL